MAHDPQAVPDAYVTEVWVPASVLELQRLHSRMLPPDPEPEPEAGL
jgi:hypothetical protein